MVVIIFIIIIAVLVLVHEVGHFLVAKKFDVLVEEFGIGLPPRAWGKKIGETLYSINWIPLGGFVKMLGEESADDVKLSEPEKARSFSSKPKWIQALVLVAGIFFNLIFAWLLISVCFSIGMQSPVGQSVFGQTQNVQTVITDVLPKSPADLAGLKAGDVIVSAEIGNEQIINPTAENISSTISKNHGDVIISYTEKNSPPKKVTITPSPNLVQGKRLIGVAMDDMGTLKLPFYFAVLEGARTTYLLTISTAQGLIDFLWQTINLKSNWSEVSGPIGIAGVVGQASRLGFIYLLSLVAIISINLALINLVPFPALDGGRLLFVAIEAVTRRQIPPKVASWLNTIGFFLLLALMLFISAHDVFNLMK